MKITEIARYAKIKGLQLVGTGDFTHSDWLKEIQDTLILQKDSGLFKLREKESSVNFMLTTEVSTIFSYENNTKKIHHVIFTPNIETAKQINQRLNKLGNLRSDGRPTLLMTAPALVEEIMEVSSDNMIFPAHAWTPWFGVFGAFSSFDSLKDCYQDMAKHIHALETGLSSDPPMNWRLSSLDKLTLLSNSDAHSFWPWRLGREANVFEFKQLTYKEIIDTIRTKDNNRLKFTIETDPAYGKYHWTGHRNCNISFSPREAQRYNNHCPVCHRKLTKGVEQRIEELSDRSVDFKPNNTSGYLRLLPLSEIISTVIKVDSPSTKAVWSIYNSLIKMFGNEYSVLMDTSKEALEAIVEKPIADAIIRVRSGKVMVIPGYDGLYGKIDLESPPPKPETYQHSPTKVQQSNLADFF